MRWWSGLKYLTGGKQTKNKSFKENIMNGKHSNVFVFLSVFFTAALLVSNILAAKQVEMTSWLRATGGITVFPITYILSDIFSEVYGYRASRRISWISFSMNLFMVLAFEIAIKLPYPAWWENQVPFEAILGSSPRIFIASVGAFQIGNWLNDIIFQKLRGTYGEKRFWLRAISSSVIGEGVDSAIFFLIAFIGLMPLSALPVMVFTGILTKVTYEIILLPVTMFIVKKIRGYEGESVYQPAKGLGIFGGR
jgi:uncharacterized integral membrane protein (TIGR00697 family)